MDRAEAVLTGLIIGATLMLVWVLPLVMKLELQVKELKKEL